MKISITFPNIFPSFSLELLGCIPLLRCWTIENSGPSLFLPTFTLSSKPFSRTRYSRCLYCPKMHAQCINGNWSWSFLSGMQPSRIHLVLINLSRMFLKSDFSMSLPWFEHLKSDKINSWCLPEYEHPADLGHSGVQLLGGQTFPVEDCILLVAVLGVYANKKQKLTYNYNSLS